MNSITDRTTFFAKFSFVCPNLPVRKLCAAFLGNSSTIIRNLVLVIVQLEFRVTLHGSTIVPGVRCVEV